MNALENIAPSSFVSPSVPMTFSGYQFNNLAGVSNLYLTTGVPATLTGTPFQIGLRSSSMKTEYHGMGVTVEASGQGDTEGEIDPNFMIQMDTAAAKAKNPSAADLIVRVASTQGGQSYAFYGSNVAGQLGTYLGFQGQTINDQQAVAVPLWRNYRYIGN